MKRLFGLSLLCLAVLLAAPGCSAKSDAPGGMAYGESAVSYDSAAADSQWEGSSYNARRVAGSESRSSPQAAVTPKNTPAQNIAAQSGEAQRKLVMRARLGIKVGDPAATDASISTLMEQYGAYSASTEINENSRSYTIRVPSMAYKQFLEALDGMGRTLNRFESAEDVTLHYYDLEGRLATKYELLKTFQSYLGKAKNIEEILSVEARIAELQGEIDRTGSELKRLANMVDYATIELNIYGPVTASDYSYAGPSLWERIKRLFGGFGGFVSTVMIILTGVVIYGIPIVLLLVLFFWLLFGRVGLVKKLWRIASGKKTGGAKGGGE